PTTLEVRSALEWVRFASQEEASKDIPDTSFAWQYGYGGFDEHTQLINRFEKLPHFTGSAWQGGATYPDGKLGWVQLSAAGGHPGNDLEHAAIRRWTAPRDMTVRLQSTLIHEPKQGEGVRGFVVSSRSGLLGNAIVHTRQAEIYVETLPVQAGETLDFVAD